MENNNIPEKCECYICLDTLKYRDNRELKTQDDIIVVLADNDIDPILSYQYVIENSKIINNTDKETGYINASKILKNCNRKWEDYYSNYKPFIEEMTILLGLKEIEEYNVYDLKNENIDSIIYTKPSIDNNEKELYVIKHVAISLCQWSSREYNVLATSIIFDYINGDIN